MLNCELWKTHILLANIHATCFIAKHFWLLHPSISFLVNRLLAHCGNPVRTGTKQEQNRDRKETEHKRRRDLVSSVNLVYFPYPVSDDCHCFG